MVEEVHNINYGFVEPARGIFSAADVQSFAASQTYANYLTFIKQCSDSVVGHTITGSTYPVSNSVTAIVKMLDSMKGWVAEYPPLQQPMRFGNKAFRSWHERLVEEARGMVVGLLPPCLHSTGAPDEILVYLTGAFGSEQRIDYGTGHETSFVVWLYCLHRLGILEPVDFTAAVLRCFSAYLEVMRTLHRAYLLEPAGSHGVWGLDDYHCLPFLWGAAQLINHPSVAPAAIEDVNVLDTLGDDYLYLGAIRFIREIKKGAPFAECCPMLNDISALPSWKKVHSGMLRLYEGEVLGQLPVVQHILFGSLLPCTWSPAEQDTRRVPPSPPPPNGGFDPYICATAPWSVQTPITPAHSVMSPGESGDDRGRQSSFEIRDRQSSSGSQREGQRERSYSGQGKRLERSYSGQNWTPFKGR